MEAEPERRFVVLSIKEHHIKLKIRKEIGYKKSAYGC